MKVKMENSLGAVKEVKVGFSWTNLLFGALTPLFRGDWKWFFIQLILSYITMGFSWLVFPFIYNKLHIKELIRKGYRPTTEKGLFYLRENGIDI